MGRRIGRDAVQSHVVILIDATAWGEFLRTAALMTFFLVR